MGGRLTLGSIAGIEVRIHSSWIIIALLIAWSFWSRFVLVDHGTTTALVMAVVATVLFFASILIHELAHSLEAQHRGVEVRGITLFLFGGATETRFDVKRPRDEFALTAVGPFASFVLAAIFGLLSFYSAMANLDVIAQVAGLLGWINLALGIFNLLPGAPLDGGRILRSAVWAITGDRRRAVRAASRTGQVLGLIIATLGLLQLFFVPGALIGGIWLMVIGWFLATAAKSESVQHDLEDQLAGLTVGDLVEEHALPTVDAQTDLATAASQLRQQVPDALAVTRDDETIGILLVDDVAKADADKHGDRPVGELVTPIDELPTIDADAEVSETLGELRGDRAIVVIAGSEQARGVITPEQLERVIKRAVQLGATPSKTAQRRGDGGHLPEAQSS